jgi:[glutamine synthetase] adenylyltransferase / [glutamine synthetase]-adenylyl-L-tyrosine phosphorylase
MPESLLELPVWKQAIRNAAAPERVRDSLKQLSTQKRELLERLSPEEARILAALFSGSQSLSAALIMHAEWLNVFEGDLLHNPRREQGLRREVAAFVEPLLQNRDYAGALSRLRLFQQRELLRIAARDLGRVADAVQTTLELSNIADICLSSVLDICAQQLSARLGGPYHKNLQEEWMPTTVAIIGLGKLGGQELNYSSDVDIIFVYSEEGRVFKEPPKKNARTERALTSHQYFNRLVEAVVAELTRAAPEGMLYRVDLRLRPEGDSGPLARSLPSYETFYSQWGQTWERISRAQLLWERCAKLLR